MKSGGRFRDKYEDNAAAAHHSNNLDAFIGILLIFLPLASVVVHLPVYRSPV